MCTLQGRETNVPTKLHEDWAKNVSSRLFTCFHYIHIEKTAPPPGGHVFPPIRTIFELVQDIYKIDAKNVTSRKTHVLTKFHKYWTKNMTSRVATAPPPGGHVFSPIWTIFELFHDDWAKMPYKEYCPAPGGHTNIFTKLHEDWASSVTSTVFTSFELSRGINGTNVLAKFHEDWTINVASRVFTRQNVDAARRTTDKRRSQKLTMST
ncbi:hypothetical protein DPMN_095611 [Dreissena polymorpha]|uniref:Uncharacterized protein n=1 Tax=Dreissena polymorpha TaxID=45954 RepID=A0A9D4L776_DREPO|nr:hypothetical protein DPMN_095611 [Dreissena polymorpha]